MKKKKEIFSESLESSIQSFDIKNRKCTIKVPEYKKAGLYRLVHKKRGKILSFERPYSEYWVQFDEPIVISKKCIIIGDYIPIDWITLT